VGSIRNIEGKKTVENLKGKISEEGKNNTNVVQQETLQFNHFQEDDKKIVQQRSSQINHSQNDRPNQQELQDNQAIQNDNNQFNLEIKSSYLKRLGIYHSFRWLHKSDRNPEEISYSKNQFANYNQVLKLRMTLFLSNFNILELCRTWEQINVEDSQIICKNKFPIMNLKENAQVMYFWKYLDSLIREEFNDDPYVYSRPSIKEQKKIWMGYSDRKKILLMLLYTLRHVIVNRQDILIRDLKEELKANENFWGSFALRWKWIEGDNGPLNSASGSARV
jgi:hypothetical protein